jgi:uncharacterized protein (DUF433 family)
MARKEHFTLRLPPKTIRRLTREAELTGTPKTALAERYLEEGMRAAQHPGIVFRDGASGRRPGIAWLGLDVWEIVETVQMNHGDAAEAADYLAITPDTVTIALDYYADYPEEIDQWIEANAALSDELEAAYRRREHVLA